ncbi:hypothetical protein HI914_02038 [Erysiphe necator]|nr:hypothetical protein HI914_02038 [Erysiphe necator]
MSDKSITSYKRGITRHKRPSPDEAPNCDVYRSRKWYGIYLEYLLKKKCQPGSQMQKRFFFREIFEI